MVKRKPLQTRGAALLRAWRGDTSQRETSRLFAIDPSVYCKFEGGKRRPGGRWAARIEALTSGAVPAASWWAPVSRAEVVNG